MGLESNRTLEYLYRAKTKPPTTAMSEFPPFFLRVKSNVVWEYQVPWSSDCMFTFYLLLQRHRFPEVKT